MKNVKLSALAVLVVTIFAKQAAADPFSHQYDSKGAQINAMLNSIGINDPDIKEFVERVSSQNNNNYITLAEKNMIGGKLSLNYDLETEGQASHKEVEVKFTPSDSNMEYLASRREIIVGYRLNFR